MSETRTLTSALRRFVFPLLVAILLVVGTVLISGSSLIRIEDVVLNRIVAGTYGTPDWRVQEMNPLLAQLLTLLYRIIPAINWYGVMLLLLLLIGAAAGIGLTARRHGGLMPAIIVVSPIIILLTNSVISTTVCALCSAVGVFSLMDGLSRRKEGMPRAVVGALLFTFAAMLELQLAVVLAIGAAICWLPCAIREERVRGLLVGLPILAVLAAALFGYTALMYNSPELSSYRNDYAVYESLQHSSLKAESDELLSQVGTQIFTEDEAETHGVDDGHDHDEAEEAEETTQHAGTFELVDWTVNDASMFFTRFSSDAKLVDPEVVRTLNAEASHWDFTPSRLFGALWETIKKPQFLLLIALFVLSALAVLVTSRRRGLVVLLAAVIAFGGHVLMIAHYYDTFAEIAPFYLLAITIALYYFNGEDARGWLKRTLTSPMLRTVLGVLVLIGFVGGMGGVLYYTRKTPANVNQFTLDAVGFLRPYIAEAHDPAILFIGDNPNERVKPSTLEVPVRGQDRYLLAGSYDLYSPRRAALMEEFGIDNPLPDSVGREDIAYVNMGFSEVALIRLSSEYGIHAKMSDELVGNTSYAEKIFLIDQYTQEEIDEAIAATEEQAALEAEAEARFYEVLDELVDSGAVPEMDAHGNIIERSPSPSPSATAGNDE